jgi:hypothetical protein
MRGVVDFVVLNSITVALEKEYDGSKPVVHVSGGWPIRAYRRSRLCTLGQLT